MRSPGNFRLRFGPPGPIVVRADIVDKFEALFARRPIEACVDTIGFCQERAVRALLDNAPFFQDNDLVGVDDG
jgi:hypothetical protein